MLSIIIDVVLSGSLEHVTADGIIKILAAALKEFYGMKEVDPRRPLPEMTFI